MTIFSAGEVIKRMSRIKPGDRILFNLKTAEYTIDDGRKIAVSFSANGNCTRVTEIFETESHNAADMQRNGWQAILNSFKAYAEKHT